MHSLQLEPHEYKRLITACARAEPEWIAAALDEARFFVERDGAGVVLDNLQLQLRIACLAGTADAGGRER